MDINKIKRIITYDFDRANKILTNKHYYNNKNDILKRGILPADKTDPMRNADNRQSHNFHQILTDEKVSYVFTYPVLFDISDKKINERITEILGDDFELETKNLGIEATNAGYAWLHYWINEKGKFQYACLNSEQCIPIYNGNLKKELIGFYRYYPDFEEDYITGRTKYYVWFEYWDNVHCEKYKFSGVLGGGLTYLPECYEEFLHDFECVPFIEFANNKYKRSDLDRYKQQIDLYDRVMSGYANDLEDIQQVIYILENYGGEDSKEFIDNLKRYKLVKVDTDVETKKSGDLRTLSIEIPVEARNSILDILRKLIYEQGQGLQQDIESVGNASGVALKFFYRKLELKSGLLQTEFKKSFNQLIRAIMKYLNISDWQTRQITQTWTRNMISNDLENSQIAQMSVGIVSMKTILKNHPLVENAEEELKQLKKEQQETEQNFDYKHSADKEGNGDVDDKEE